MATTKKTTTKTTKKTAKAKEAPTAQDIIGAYMEHVLEHGDHPITIYKFCKANNFTEAEFYQHFGSFKNLKQGVWVAFHKHTIAILHKDKAFETYANKEKMLSYFYTLFEMFTANRSYVLFALQEHKHMLKKLEQLKQLRTHVKQFATELIEAGNEQKNYKFTKNSVTIFSEGAWLQLLFLLNFWMEDNTAAFEKTDLAIEKSVTAIFDVFETTPLESIIDFGKFIFKNKFQAAGMNNAFAKN